jgi:hypothetical protein
MKEKQSVDISSVESLLSPSEAAIALLPLTAIKESDHAFFWGSFFLSIATCLFGCAASLYAAAYEHLPFIVLLAIFGCLFLLLFVIFAIRGLQIRKRARARERLKQPGDVLYQQSSADAAGRASVSRIQEGIRQALGDGAARTREEIIGILSSMSTDEVDVGTLHQVLYTLVDVGVLAETEQNGKKLFTFRSEPAPA